MVLDRCCRPHCVYCVAVQSLPVGILEKGLHNHLRAISRCDENPIGAMAFPNLSENQERPG
jgi:hypothetical protein